MAHWSWGYDTVGGQPLFPIRRQVHPDYAVLGRPFLQEAYIHANYEPDVMKFNVSQRAFPAANTPSEIITVQATPDRIIGDDDTISRGAIAGIVIGSVAGVALVAFGIWFFVVRRKRNKRKAEEEAEKAQAASKSDEFGDYVAGDPRRGTVSSTWSAAATEIDGTSSFPSSPRPVHARHQSAISEMSSDSDHERSHDLMATLHEAPYETGDKTDASTYEELERRMKLAQQQPSPGGPSPLVTPMVPGELPGSYDWANGEQHDNTGAANTQSSASPQVSTPQAATPVAASPQATAIQPASSQSETPVPSAHLAP